MSSNDNRTWTEAAQDTANAVSKTAGEYAQAAKETVLGEWG